MIKKIIAVPSRVINLLKTVQETLKEEIPELKDIQILVEELLFSYSRLETEVRLVLEDPSKKHRNIRDLRQEIKCYLAKKKEEISLNRILNDVKTYLIEKNYNQESVAENIQILEKEIGGCTTVDGPKIREILIQSLTHLLDQSEQIKKDSQKISFENTILQGLANKPKKKKSEKSSDPVPSKETQKKFEDLILKNLSDASEKKKLKKLENECLKTEESTKILCFETTILNRLSNRLIQDQERKIKKNIETQEKEIMVQVQRVNFEKTILESKLDDLKKTTEKINQKKSDRASQHEKKKADLNRTEAYILNALIQRYDEQRIAKKIKQLEERYKRKTNELNSSIENMERKILEIDTTKSHVQKEFLETQESIKALDQKIKEETDSLCDEQRKLAQNEIALNHVFKQFFEKKKLLKNKIVNTLNGARNATQKAVEDYQETYQEASKKIDHKKMKKNDFETEIKSKLESAERFSDQLLKDLNQLE